MSDLWMIQVDRVDSITAVFRTPADAVRWIKLGFTKDSGWEYYHRNDDHWFEKIEASTGLTIASLYIDKCNLWPAEEKTVEPRKVYIPMQSIKYEGETLFSVCSSREVAEKEVLSYIDDHPNSYPREPDDDGTWSHGGDLLYIEEYVVHDDVHQWIPSGPHTERCTICNPIVPDKKRKADTQSCHQTKRKRRPISQKTTKKESEKT